MVTLIVRVRICRRFSVFFWPLCLYCCLLFVFRSFLYPRQIITSHFAIFPFVCVYNIHNGMLYLLMWIRMHQKGISGFKCICFPKWYGFIVWSLPRSFGYDLNVFAIIVWHLCIVFLFPDLRYHGFFTLSSIWLMLLTIPWFW